MFEALQNVFHGGQFAICRTLWLLSVRKRTLRYGIPEFLHDVTAVRMPACVGVNDFGEGLDLIAYPLTLFKLFFQKTNPLCKAGSSDWCPSHARDLSTNRYMFRVKNLVRGPIAGPMEIMVPAIRAIILAVVVEERSVVVMDLITFSTFDVGTENRKVRVSTTKPSQVPTWIG